MKQYVGLRSDLIKAWLEVPSHLGAKNKGTRNTRKKLFWFSSYLLTQLPIHTPLIICWVTNSRYGKELIVNVLCFVYFSKKTRCPWQKKKRTWKYFVLDCYWPSILMWIVFTSIPISCHWCSIPTLKAQVQHLLIASSLIQWKLLLRCTITTSWITYRPYFNKSLH